MEERQDEVIFQTAEEAFQKLADLTGKKIMVPDKAEPTVAEENQEEEAVTGGTTKELADKLREQGEKYGEAADKLEDIDSEIESFGTAIE